MISIGRSNSATMQMGMAPPQGCSAHTNGGLLISHTAKWLIGQLLVGRLVVDTCMLTALIRSLIVQRCVVLLCGHSPHQRHAGLFVWPLTPPAVCCAIVWALSPPGKAWDAGKQRAGRGEAAPHTSAHTHAHAPHKRALRGSVGEVPAPQPRSEKCHCATCPTRVCNTG